MDNEQSLSFSNEQIQSPENIPSGVSIESASYIEKNNLENDETESFVNESYNEEHVPKLFSEDQNHQSEDDSFENIDHKNEEADQLFNQDIEEEDFEIPAFLENKSFNVNFGLMNNHTSSLNSPIFQ